MTTLLTAVNDTLKRLSLIQGDAGALTSLADAPRQVWIDQVVQSWNEALDELYTTVGEPFPNILAEATITLATSTRAYALATALQRLYWPLLDTTRGRTIEEYPGGYMVLVSEQLTPASYTGLANYAAIRPTDGYLYLDRIPQAAENGFVYTYRYETDGVLDEATDTLPVGAKCYRALIPVVAQLVNREQKRDFDADLFRLNLGRAARLLRQRPPAGAYVSFVRAGPAVADWQNPYPD